MLPQGQLCKNNYIRPRPLTASTQNLTFGAYSAGTNNTFAITTKGGSSQNALVTTINLGTVEQTLQFTAPTAASSDTITVTLTDHNSTTFSVAIASTFNSADSARAVACEFVDAANALFPHRAYLIMHMKLVRER